MLKYQYFNRDLSWLMFNYRVLEEAYDETLPLFERIKFLAIYSNNLEEFYRVRVSYYRSLIKQLPEDHPKMQQVDPVKVIQKINSIVSRHQAEFNDVFYNRIIPEMRQEGIILVEDEDDLSQSQRDFIFTIFSHEILPSLEPILLVKRRVKPFLKTGHSYIVLRLFTKIGSFKNPKKGKLPKYGMIKLPTDHGISRFIEIPSRKDKHYIMFLEDLIMQEVKVLFPGYFIDSWYNIKVTRDADMDMEEFDEEDLIEIIENLEQRRAIGEPNRFQFDRRMPGNMLNYLIDTFDVSRNNLVKGGRTNNFRDFFSFPNPLSPKLETDKHTPLSVPKLEMATYLFDAIEKEDFILNFPYQSFDYFIQFLNEAAQDKDVIQINTTQYRVASNSAVVNALIKAALNGKKVNVFVELKARFDEEMNLQYAREMKKAGINIMYSIPGFKVHSKMAMVTRKKDGKVKNLVFLGTGNFNEKTARIYCDHGFFTAHKGITDDVALLFAYLNDQNIKCNFSHILVPNNNMVRTFKSLIEQEIEFARNGKHAYILLKMNGLEDPAMISLLYKASENGVKIDCIVRGACCLIPGEKYSKNIRVIRIVDKFLEHARVFLFYHNGENILYLGSADWMKRNLYKRIECDFPIYKEHLKQEIIDILNIQLSDNVSARELNNKLENTPITGGKLKVRAQSEIYQYLRDKMQDEA